MFSGIDSEGHAANFVETEQIVQYSGAKASFIQVSQREPKSGVSYEIMQICVINMGSDPSLLTDTWLHSVLLVPASKPEIQTQTTDQQEWQPREMLYVMIHFLCRKIHVYVCV